MIRLSHRDLEACSRALPNLYSETSMPALEERTLAVVSDLISCDVLSYDDWKLDNFGRVRAYRALRRPLVPEVDEFSPAVAACIHDHPLFPKAMATHAPGPVKISDFATRRQLRRTAIYNEFYRHLSIESQIISTISWEKNSRNYVVLNRTGKDFSERDRNVLTFLTPHIAQAIRNAGIADIMASQLNVLGDGIDAMGRATILVGADGRIHWQSSLAREWLKEFFPGSESARECLPAPVTKWLKQNEQKSPAGKRAFSSLQTPSITKCRLLIYSGKTGCGETVLALIRERLDLDLATGQSYGLTPREAEILYWISEAKTRPEIGAILGISWRTIGKHMERIFAKLGVENRLEAQRIGLELRRV
jgi:DNA-binding CsgD family transcriptional regulator